MQQAGTPSRSSQGWRSIAVDDPEIAAWYEQLRADHPDEPKGIVDHMDASIRAYGDGSGRGYDYKTAIEGGLRPSMQPDGKYHWGGEAGEVIVKGKQHPTRHLTDQAKSQAVQDKGFDDLLLALDGDPAPSGRVEDASDEMDDLLEVLDADLLQWADVSPTRVGRYFQGMGESVRSGEGLPSLIGLGIQGYNMGQVVLAAQRVQANEGTEEDEQLLSRFQVEQAKEAVRNQYLSYRSGGMTAQSGAFMADILTTAGAGALGKAALKKGLIEGAESIAEKAITKSLAARAAKSVGKAAADITKLTVGMEALGQVGAHIGGKGILQREEGEGFGGGIITNETWRAAREKFHVLAEVDPNGELYTEILGHTPDFIDVLDEGIVSALIEVGSEQSGEAILYGMKRSLPWLSKLPLADRARVVYGGAMVTLSQKYGIPVPQAASILRRAGFHGPPIEIVEEYIGEAARKTAPNLEGHTWNTEDFWDQSFETSNHLAEIAISSAVIGGVGGVVGLAAGPPEVPLRQRVESKVQRLGEELTEAGLEREAREAEGLMDLTGEAPSLEQIETQIAQLDEDLAEGQRLLEMSDAEMESELRRALGDELPAGSEESTKLVQQLGEGEDVPLHPPMPMTGPGEIDAVVDQGLQRMQEDFPGLRLAEIPEEHSVAAEVIQLQAKEQDAVDVVFVTGDEMFTAMQAGEGVHFVNVNRLGDLAHVVSLRVHESIHDVAARNSDLFDRLRRALAAHDPEGFAGHMDDYQQKWAEVGAAVNLPPGLATEEGIAHYAQTYAGPISYLRTKRGQQWLKEVYEQEPGLFRQIVEFVKDLLARVGLPTTGRQQRELDKLTKHLEGLGRGPGRRLTPAVLDAVEQIAAALDSVLGHGPSRLQSPSQRQGPAQGVGTPETTETPPQAPEAPEAREEAAEAAPDAPTPRAAEAPAVAGVPPIVREMMGALGESLEQIRGRVSNVRQGPIRDGVETFTFEFDGKVYEGRQEDVLRDVVVGWSPEADAKIASTALVQQLAEQTGELAPTPRAAEGAAEGGPRKKPRSPKRQLASQAAHRERRDKLAEGGPDVPFRLFIRANGGIRNNDGDLDAFTVKHGGKEMMLGGFGLAPIIQREDSGKGMIYDRALEKAGEGGYFQGDPKLAGMGDLIELLESNLTTGGWTQRAESDAEVAEAEALRQQDEMAQAEGFEDAEAAMQHYLGGEPTDRFAAPHTDSYSGLSPEERARVDAALADSVNGDVVRGLLDDYAGSPWTRQALAQAAAREGLKLLIKGVRPTFYSSWGAPSMQKLANMILGGGKEAIWSRLAHQATSMIGNPSKPLNAVNASFLNCEPSPECAASCYATTGRNFPANVVKSELVEWAVREDPVRAAEITAAQYKMMAEFHKKKALRLFDKGDGAPHWIPYIEKLNELGVRVQVFSKHADFLRQVPEMNLRLFSVDGSSLRGAGQIKDLPMAFVFTGAEKEVRWIKAHKEQVQVILPIKLGNKLLDDRAQAQIVGDRDLLPKICPVDRGTVKIGDDPTGKIKDNWNCTRCDAGGGVGCFYKTTTEEALRVSYSLQSQPANDRKEWRDELERLVRNIPAGERASARKELDALLREVRADHDTEAEAGFDPKAAGTASLEQEDGQTTGGLGEEGREDVADRFAAPRTDTPAFKRWFGDSKVVDAEGKPLVVYHGTSDRFTSFSTAQSRDGMFYFTDEPDVAGGYLGRSTAAYRKAYDAREKAYDAFMAGWEKLPLPAAQAGEHDGRTVTWSWFWYASQDLEEGYGIDRAQEAEMDALANALDGADRALDRAEPAGGGSVMPTYLSIQNPHIVESAPHLPWDLVNSQALKAAIAAGNDGVIIRNTVDTATGEEIPATVYVAFRPEQIKSATGNRGTFDPTNPDIRYAAPRTDTPAFKRWFWDSKVVDAQGRPLVMYHHTDAHFTEFREGFQGRTASGMVTDEGFHGEGFYFGTMEYLRNTVYDPGSPLRAPSGLEEKDWREVAAMPRAERDEYQWAEHQEMTEAYTAGVGIMPVFLSIKNPRIIEDWSDLTTRGMPREENERQGYDGVLVLNEGRLVAAVAFRPEQIKSATGNRGTFDPTNPDIRYSVPRTDTPAFKRWFSWDWINDRPGVGRSALVDAEGKPLVLYHLTRFGKRQWYPDDNKVEEYEVEPFTEFKPGGLRPALSGPAIWLSPNPGHLPAAHNVPNALDGAAVYPLYVSMRTPLYIDVEQDPEHRDWLLDLHGREFPYLLSEASVGELRGEGYDGIVMTRNGVIEEVVAFRSEQVKSATGNRGTFDPTNPDIRYSVPRTDQLGFFSQAEKAALDSPQKSYHKAQVRPRLKKYGTKDEELDWMGLDEWLKGLPKGHKVTQEELLAFIRENAVVVGEKVLGGANHAELRRLRDAVTPASGAFVQQAQADGVSQLDEANVLLSRSTGTSGRLRAGDFGSDELRTLAASYWDALDAYQEAYARHGGTGDSPKYPDYTEPGGSNYRELLLTLPQRGQPSLPPGWKVEEVPVGEGEDEYPYPGYWRTINPQGYQSGPVSQSRDEAIRDALSNSQNTATDPATYTSGHFDEPNVLAHVRFNERTDAEGARVLFIEEVQSDWHQAGREKGYVPARDGTWDIFNVRTGEVYRNFPTEQEAKDFMVSPEARALPGVDWAPRGAGNVGGDVPDAPFKTSWPTLAMKRMVRWAAENNFDSIAWTTGAMQVGRYESAMRSAVDSIEWKQNYEAWSDRGWVTRVEAKKGDEVAFHATLDKRGVVDVSNADEAVGKPIEDIVGKEIARQILTEDSGKVEGEGLTIGGKGMTEFYDKRLVSTANKLGKKFGAKVGRANITKDEYEPFESASGVAIADPFMDEGNRFRVDPQEYYGATPQKVAVSVPSLPITQEMRESVTQVGLERFAAPGRRRLVPLRSKSGGQASDANTFFAMEGAELWARRGGPAAFDIPKADTMNAWIERWQNRMRSVQRTVQAAGAEGSPVDVFMAEMLRRGKTKELLRLLDYRYQRPVKAVMNKYNLTQEQVGEDLQAYHAKERNREMQKRNPDHPLKDRLSGMSNADARAIKARNEASEEAGGYRRIRRILKRMHKENLQIMVDSGLLSAEVRDTLEGTYKNYVPLKTLLSEDDPRSIFLGLGSGINLAGPEVKRAMGRVSQADTGAVLAFAFTQGEIIRARSEKARVNATLLAFIRKYPNPEYYTEQPIETKPGIGKDGIVREVYDPSFKVADNVVSVKEYGEEIHIQFSEKHPDMAIALKGLNMVEIGPLTKLSGKATHFLSRASTEWNLAFPPFNAIRDFRFAWTTLEGEHGKKIAFRVMRDVASGKAFRALHRMQTGKAIKGGKLTKLDEYAQRWRPSGAPMSLHEWNSVNDSMRKIAKDVRQADAQGLAMGKEWAKAFFQAISHINNLIENQSRFMAFVHVQEMGLMNEDQAASYAKNLTTNFEQKGTMGHHMNSWWMFSNANVQGNVRGGQALMNKGVQKLVAKSVVAAMLLDLWNRAVSGDDDDGENAYDAIPDYQKKTSTIIMVPGTTDAIHLPNPFVFRWFHYVGTKAGAMLFGPESFGDASYAVTEALFDEVNPLGGEDFVQSISPTVADIPVQIWGNEDWAGRAIMPAEFPGTIRADAERHFPTVSPTARKLAKWMNEATGGDTIEGGVVDVSPETLEHYAKNISGGAGATFGRVLKIVDKAIAGEAITVADIPIARRLFKEQSPHKSRTTYNENVRAIKTVQKRVEALQEAGKTEKAQDLIREEAHLWGLGGAMKEYGREVRARKKAGRPEAEIRELYNRFNQLVFKD